MFSPSREEQLAGEVDHSFFDSDYKEVPSVPKDGAKKEEEVGVSITVLSKHTGSSPQPPHAGGCVGSARGRTPQREVKEEEETRRRRASPTSSASSSSSSSTARQHRSGDADRGGASSPGQRGLDRDPGPAAPGPPGADRTGSDEEDDGYCQSQDDSEEEQLASCRSPGGRSGVSLTSAKKRARHRRASPPPSSTDMDTRTTSDRSGASSSSSSSSSSRAGLDRPPRPPPAGDSSASEDTVTDVTPLSSPPGRVSPYPTGWFGKMTLKEEQPVVLWGVATDPPQDHHDSGPNLNEVSLSVEELVSQQRWWELPQHQAGPRPGSRKNYSFSDQEVRRIDRENQRLLHALSRPSPQQARVQARVRPAGASVSVASGRTQPGDRPALPAARLWHSGLNRQREQQRIKRENLAFLKVLVGVKASPGLRRIDQLADHQKQASYPGRAPSSFSTSSSTSSSSTPLLRPAPRGPSRAAAATPGAGRRPTRTPERDRTSSTSTSTHAPRSRRPPSQPQPDWC
ncbi:hypothetical protein CRUP_005919 [Coryphaenoides rupestris]|nr:hypothetical protein CRUP_005919 [Coryphaenoides rupestris]